MLGHPVKVNVLGVLRNVKAMMVIYLPVKFEFDWTKTVFELESGNEKCGRTRQSNRRVGYTQPA